jgi:hypothetical protein
MNHVRTAARLTILHDTMMAALGASAVTTENDGTPIHGFLVQRGIRARWNLPTIRQSLTTVEQALAPRPSSGLVSIT